MRLAAHASSSLEFVGLGLDVSGVDVQSYISQHLYCKFFFPDPINSTNGRNIPAVSPNRFPFHFPFDSAFAASIPLTLNPDWVQLSKVNLCSYGRSCCSHDEHKTGHAIPWLLDRF